MAKRPLVNHAMILGATKRAVDSWLEQSGKVSAPSKIDLTHTFASYGLDARHVRQMSNHVIDAVKAETGIDFQLTADQLRNLSWGTLTGYIEGVTIQLMDALPGKPSTPSSGPIDDD